MIILTLLGARHLQAKLQLVKMRLQFCLKGKDTTTYFMGIFAVFVIKALEYKFGPQNIP